MRFASWFAIIVGILMLGKWAFFLVTGNVPELSSEPIRIGFHLAAEFSTTVALVVSGWATLRGKTWGRPLLLASMGMLIYTSIVSPGYFAQQGQVIFVVMFGASLLVALVSMRAPIR